MKNNKSDLINRRIAFIGSIISILLVAAVGFAYFSATVVNTNNERLSTETATLSLKFDDGDSGISGTLNLGESITKKFTLQNTGTLDAYAKINWYNLVNTYMNGSLTYNLEQSTSENGTYTSIDSSNVPISSTETTETLKNGILVPVNTTYYYKLTITFNNLENVNQNSDINARFYSYFSLEEGNLSGTDKIQNLVAGANTSSLDVITKEAPAGSTCTNTLAYDGTTDNNLRYVGANPCNYVTFNGEAPTSVDNYQMYADGNISTNSPRFGYSGGQEYPDEATCQNSGLNGSFASSGNDGTAVCTLNPDTNKYYIEAHGYLTSLGDYANQSECESAYSSQGMQGSSTPSGLSCRKHGKKTVGGWRIIGVMNNVDDGTGKKETRIKLVRNDSLGNYSWDTSESSVNNGWGVNDWTQADLMQELNGDYLNTSLTANTVWYNGQNNQKTAEYDYTKGLKATAQAQIGNAKWHLGGMKYNENNDLIPSTMYTKERGTEVWPQGASYSAICNDGVCPRATEWTGKVALIYPSDYGYATSGGETTARSACIGTLSTIYDSSGTGETWMNSSYSNCKDNDWLNTYQWALSPSSNYSRSAFFVDSGIVDYYTTESFGPVAPAVYLKSSVSISEGEGTESEPFVIG